MRQSLMITQLMPIEKINKYIDMKTQSLKIECPECGSRETLYEYGQNLLSLLSRQIEKVLPTDPLWYYCQCCGVKFNPFQEAFAVC